MDGCALYYHCGPFAGAWSVPGAPSPQHIVVPLKQHLTLFVLFRRADDTAKAEMTHRGIEHLRRARRGAEPQTVVGGAEMRPSLDHFARYSDLRLCRIEAVFDGCVAP